MQDLNDLYYFAKVVEHGGFAPAGRALGEPKSKLSRRIALLEERLGVRLIQRSTRKFSVTEVGQTYYAHVQAMLVEADAAAQAIEMTRAQPRGTVRLSCPTMLLDFRVGAMLADFMAQCPDVQIHLEDTNRRVDVIAEGFDLAIRVRPPPLEDSDLVLRVLGERGQGLVASPGLVERTGSLMGPADLAGVPSVALGVPQADHAWHLIGPDGATADVRLHPRLVTRGMLALREAACAGVGVAKLPLMIVQQEIERGQLVRVLPDWAPPREVIHIVYPSRRGLLPSVRALIDHLVAAFEALQED